MKIKEILTKENFWNEMIQKYPKAMKIFCDWIDEYKKEVKWNDLFQHETFEHYFERKSHTIKFYERQNLITNKEIKEAKRNVLFSCWSKEVRIIKFHDIPYAMQLGIWIEFCLQNLAFEIDIEKDFELKHHMEHNLELIETGQYKF